MIPQWQRTQLQQMSSAGMLSGVDPTILEAIDAAESGGGGGAVNPQGYGGFFGLGSNTQYPTGRTSPQLLAGTDTSSFGEQAMIAAGEFASLLESNHMDPLAAEQAYQGGGTEGTTIFQEYGIGHTTSPPSLVTTPGMATLTATTTGNGSLPPTKIASVGPFSITTPYGLLSRALLMVIGIFLLYLGFKELFSDHGGPDTVVVGGGNALQSMRRKAAEAGEAGAAAA